MNLKHPLVYICLILLINSNLFSQQLLDQTITHDGETREYKIYFPASYDGSTPYPLIFNFHGGGGDINSQIAVSDMRPMADTASFIVVYPQALPDPNDGGSTNWLHKEPTDVDDVFFVDAMIDAISAEHTIDENRIYACGYSLGGEFTYELACRLNERIAAVGVVARTMGAGTLENCSPSHPTGIITILGTDDFISPYDGLEWNGTLYYISADAVHSYWATYNNTSSEPNISQLPNTDPTDGSTVEQHLWENGDGCVSVKHLKVIGGEHDWPGTFGNMDINASVEIWNYVSQYDLEGLIDCSTTSIHENIDKQLVIYPNPVTTHLSIDLPSTNIQEYQIYSTGGKLISSGKIEPNNKEIDVSDISLGVYLLKIGDKEWKFIKK